MAAAKTIEAFGECKSLRSWAHDKRCNVTLTLMSKRLKDGWEAEAAISIPARGTLREAFGEHKTLTQWLKDPRCVRPESTVCFRLKRGWELEDAMTRPQVSDSHVLYTAFGESKTRRAWSRDLRFGMPYHTLLKRLGNGLQLEDALTRPLWAKEALPKSEQFRIARIVES